MKKEDFDAKAREASKAMTKKKAPTRPETQFVKGAEWAWQMLMASKERPYYVEQLRQELAARLGEEGMRENEGWIESLLEETAEKMCRLDGFREVVEREGYLLEKFDKNMNLYKESNPLLVHMKELDRTIGMQREHLGLSFKVNPNRMKESPKQGNIEDDPMVRFVKGRERK